MEFSPSLAKLLAADRVTCDTMPIIEDFDATRYMGTWYEQVHSKGQHYQPDDNQMICIMAEYSDLNTETGEFKLYNSSQDIQQDGNPRQGVDGTAKCPSREGVPNWCQVFISSYDIGSNYHIFDTDYDSYAMVYNCAKFENFIYFYILSREPKLDDETLDGLIAKAKTVIPNYNFDTMYFDVQDERCDYLTTPQFTF